MAGVCKACRHPDKLQIERLIARGESYRSIAKQFGISDASITRHVQKCIPLILEELRASQNHKRAINVEDEISRAFSRLNKLLDACDVWLTDPDDPALYSLDARANELSIIYEDGNDLTPKGNPKRKRDTLSVLLRQLEDGGLETLSVTSKHADPRELIVKTAGEIKGQLELFARLQGLFQRDRANESDREHEKAMITAVNGEVKRLVNAGWSEEDAKAIVHEAVPDAKKWVH
jgi:hypothetical protein